MSQGQRNVPSQFEKTNTKNFPRGSSRYRLLFLLSKQIVKGTWLWNNLITKNLTDIFYLKVNKWQLTGFLNLQWKDSSKLYSTSKSLLPECRNLKVENDVIYWKKGNKSHQLILPSMLWTLRAFVKVTRVVNLKLAFTD